jgi:prephenate dehydrogenase
MGWAKDLTAAVRGADIVILAVPVDSMLEVAEQVLPLLTTGQIVTDVASVKVSPSLILGAAGNDVIVVGGHPMAGAETGGFESSYPALFDGCTWVLCPQDGATVPSILTQMVHDVGADRVLVYSPEEHDRAVAAISHGVQASVSALAAAVGDSVGADELPWQIAACGWKDSTRVADSDPDMWVPILLENADNVVPILERVRDRMDSMIDALMSADADRVHQILHDGQAARSEWRDRGVSRSATKWW